MINIETVQIDTDSKFDNLEPVVEYKFGGDYATNVDDETIYKFLIDFTENEMLPIIDKCILSVNDMFNAMDENTTAMGCEIIGKTMVSTGKKRYLMEYGVKDGIYLSKPKQKITGIEIKRSDTPSYFKEMLVKSLDYIFALDEKGLQHHVKNVKKEMKEKAISEIAKPITANDVEKYKNGKTKDVTSVPMHYRAVNNYNRYIKEKGLDGKLPTIEDGDKIRYIFLRDKFNIFGDDVIAFKSEDHIYQMEPNIKKFIDYIMTFEKGFESPLKRITDVLGWDLEPNIAKGALLFS